MNEERPIEKLLRRYAQQRRDEAGPPPELHPATRRLLQGEVARQFSSARAVRAGGFWGFLRARWIYAATSVVVIGGSMALLWPVLFPSPNVTSLAAQSEEMALAKATVTVVETNATPEARTAGNQSEAAATAVVAPVVTEPEPEPASLARTALPPPAGLDMQTAATSAEAEANRRAFSTRYGLAPAAPTTRPEADRALRSSAPTSTGSSVSAGGLREMRASGTGQKGTPAGQPPSSGPTSPARTRADFARTAAAPANDPAIRSQSFANVASASAAQRAKQSATVPVLDNFRVEQAGNQVRVIDGDGSTYVGTLPESVGARDALAEARADAPAFSQRAAPPGQGPPPQQQSANYLYFVTGTNVTLQKPVSFTWNFLPPSNAPGVASLQARDNFQNQQFLPWSNLNINGQVRVNSGTQFELNAVPVPR